MNTQLYADVVILPGMHGTFQTIDDQPAVHFERRLSHPIDAVWRAVTEPDELAHWFPARVTVDLSPGGRMRFDMDEGSTEGEITELDPPRRFAFTWGEERLRIELEEAGDECVMRFTHVLSSRDQAARDAAGWHVCLDRLETWLGGGDATAPGNEPTSEWRGHYEEYQRRGMPVGAYIPGD
jgi:uncharacterized protein YndB with AHSA1/START domain